MSARVSDDFIVFKIEFDLPLLHRCCADDGFFSQTRYHHEFVCQTQAVQIKIQWHTLLDANEMPFVGSFDFDWIRQVERSA